MNLIWILVCVAFAIFEAIIPSLTLIWFSIGAIVTLLLSGFIKSFSIQVLVFAVVSITLLVIFTNKFVKEDKTFEYKTNLKAIVGKNAVVVEDIKENEGGVVKLDFENWSAISFDNKEILKGKTVSVVEIEGVKLIVMEV
ncbi:MAG: NfeD family protein [Peptostreptococcaceae bacterium]